jgi:PDZ domain-containing secreted protein
MKLKINPRTFLILLVLLIDGCSTQSANVVNTESNLIPAKKVDNSTAKTLPAIKMVNSEGKVYPCAANGTSDKNTCVEDMEKAGYVRIADVAWGVHMASWDTSPAKVKRVDMGSPAEIAGVKKGDIIQELDGQTVSNAKQILAILAKKKAGDTLLAKVKRGKTQIEILSTLRNK